MIGPFNSISEQNADIDGEDDNNNNSTVKYDE
jgi:hypothetical protein